MYKYGNLGITDRLQSIKSIFSKEKVIPAFDFESRFEVQQNRVNTSKLNVKELVKLSTVSTAKGTFNISQSLVLKTTLTYRDPFTNTIIYALPQISIYQGSGTAIADQIYPVIGTNVTLGRYDVQGNFDLTGWNGKQGYWRGVIHDTNGTSSQVITFASQWRYIDYKFTSV